MKYSNQEIIEQRKTLAEELYNNNYYGAEEAQAERILSALMDRLPERLFCLSEAGQGYETVWAADINDALEMAEDRFERGNYDDSDNETWWCDFGAYDVANGDHQSSTLQVDPKEPDCEDDQEHDWCSPIEVVGGIKENPGVFGNGGGIIIKSVCSHCGIYRITNTWAQRPDTGEQGLESVSYEPADRDSLVWVESQKEEENGDNHDIF